MGPEPLLLAGSARWMSDMSIFIFANVRYLIDRDLCITPFLVIFGKNSLLFSLSKIMDIHKNWSYAEVSKRKNHSPEFKARVALDAIREKLMLAELSKKYGVHSGQISTWKRAALDNMSSAFRRRGSDLVSEVSAGEIEKLHSKIGQL